MSQRIDVAAGLVWQALGPSPRLLLASRPLPKVYAGWWELPGGKFEPGEGPEEALARELQEELGLVGLVVHRRTCLDFDYAHAKVRLHFCDAVSGGSAPIRPAGKEGQQWVWVDPSSCALPCPILPATRPLIERFQSGEWKPWLG